MEKLNLPAFEYDLKKVNAAPYIYDLVRKKYVALGPEEWVRQHFLHFLMNNYGYPRTLFAVESGLYYNKLHKRHDILALSTLGKPFLLVECKAPGVKISEVTIGQVARYNFTIRPSYIAITNGMAHYCLSVQQNGEVVFYKDLPRHE